MNWNWTEYKIRREALNAETDASIKAFKEKFLKDMNESLNKK